MNLLRIRSIRSISFAHRSLPLIRLLSTQDSKTPIPPSRFSISGITNSLQNVILKTNLTDDHDLAHL